MKKNSNKKVIVILFMGMFCVQTGLDASLMPGLKKMRDKLDKALESAPAVTFKDLVQAQNSAAGQALHISPSGARFVGLAHSYRGDARIKNVQEKIKTLYWSMQHDVILSIKQEEQANKNQAMTTIKDAVSKKYTGLKAPILLFAQDLAQEEKNLKELDQELTKLLLANDVRSDKEGLLKTVQALITDVKAVSGDLQDLIGCVNRLLLA